MKEVLNKGIKVSQKTYDLLVSIGKMDETFNDVISRIAKFYKEKGGE